jgi:hypothetical protein
MPDLNDAIQVVTDRSNLSGSGDTRTGMRAVHEQKAVAALRAQGAGRAEARDLAMEAVRDIGGTIESRMRSGGMAAGRDTRRVVDTWLVPIDKIRD